jgi:hypothetical protein
MYILKKKWARLRKKKKKKKKKKATIGKKKTAFLGGLKNTILSLKKTPFPGSTPPFPVKNPLKTPQKTPEWPQKRTWK